MAIKTYFFRPNKEMPAYKNKRPGKDAGYDLFALEDVWLWPFQTKKINTNSHIHIPSGHFGRVTSRSGHALRGWLTHSGTVDSGYTGNIGVIQTNISLFPRKIKKGERIAQLIFIPFSQVEFEEIENKEDYEKLVKELTQSDRGNQGYNSSGIL